MRTIDPDLLLTLDSYEVEGLAALVEIAPKGETIIRKALWNDDILFEGQTFFADQGEFSEVKFEAQTVSPGFELQLQNLTDPITEVDVPWSEYLKDKKRRLEGAEVILRFVDVFKLNKGSIRFGDWAVGNARLTNQGYLSLKCGMRFDILELQTLMPTLGSVICYWRYKIDPGCGSISPLQFCNHTVTDCILRHPNRPLRFSSWPFLDAMLRRVQL